MSNQAVFIDQSSPSRLAIREAPEPAPRMDEAIVSVRAISLNRGETVRATSTSPQGWRPGWDLAGEVIQSAGDGSGPSIGQRVVGLLREGAWARRVAVPTSSLAVVPDKVSLAEAASLPVAALTALHALDRGGSLAGKRVLITGASGGVGDFAIQLARLSGASVIAAHLRSAAGEIDARKAGATDVVIGPLHPSHVGPFDIGVDSVGGDTLAAVLACLASGGVCASLGVSDRAEVTFNARQFFLTGRLGLYGINLFEELRSREEAGKGLARLLRLVASRALIPRIAVEASWVDIAKVARRLVAREFTGKTVLHIN